MYSPKIKNDLIPMLYRLRSKLGIPMTRLVDEIIRPVIQQMHFEEIECDPEYADLDRQIRFEFVKSIEVVKPRKKSPKKGVYNVQTTLQV